MGLIDENNVMVMIIDVQEKLLNSVFNKEICAKKSSIMAKTASILNLPVVVTEQYPKGLGSTISVVKDSLKQDLTYFEKKSFSALENPEIFQTIKDYGKKQVLIFGIETHICVSQTVDALVRAGYEVFVVKDACGSRAEVEYLAGIERMKDNGAKIITTEIALFELIRSAKHEHFKEIQALIK